MLRGTDTALGDAGDKYELFATTELREVPLSHLSGSVEAVCLKRPWRWELRSAHFLEDEQLRSVGRQRLVVSGCLGSFSP